MIEKDPIFVKIIIVGDSGVGKTSLLNRYCYSKFDSSIAPTVGTDFSTKIIKTNETTLRLQLWDVAGQERFKAVTKMYIRGCLGCILVADSTKEESLLNLIEWKNIVLENADYMGEDYVLPFVVLENKVDLLQTQSESKEKYPGILKEKENKLEDFVKMNNFSKGFLTSAKENINLSEAFMFLAESIFVQLDGRHKKTKETNFASFKEEIKLDSKIQEKKKCC